MAQVLKQGGKVVLITLPDVGEYERKKEIQLGIRRPR